MWRSRKGLPRGGNCKQKHEGWSEQEAEGDRQIQHWMGWVCVCPWCVHVSDVCMLVVSVLLVYACPWRVRIPGVCVSLMCVCVTRLCMSRVCVCPWGVCVPGMCVSLLCACAGSMWARVRGR